MNVASSLALQTDHIFYVLLICCGTLAFLVFAVMTYFLLKYRAGRKVNRENPRKHQKLLEIMWITGPLILFVSLYVWGAKAFFAIYVPPHDAVEVNVVAKQWMWKFYRTDGLSEINELHVPLGQTTRLIMTSEDVIHSFFVPDFRIKQDVLPGRYSSLWFTPILVGRFHLFCAQFCGTNHAGMNGYITVMAPEDFNKWRQTQAPAKSSLARGEFLYRKFQCAHCHDDHPDRAPNLRGLANRSVALDNGTQVIADEIYLEESILRPAAKVVQGFKDVMPSYAGQMSEADLMALTSYIKSLNVVAEKAP